MSVRILAIDAFDFQKCEISLPRFRWPDLTANEIAGQQSESLYLRGRDVDVVRAGEIAVVLAAQKSVALGQNLEHAFAVQRDVRVEQVLLDSENQLGLRRLAVSGILSPSAMS